MFSCFKNSNDTSLFFQYLNTCHLHIMFTMETEEKPGSVAIFRVLEIMKAYVSLLFITPSY